MIPWEVIRSDGSTGTQQEEVLQKWQQDFQGLYNPERDDTAAHVEQNMTAERDAIETGMNDRISNQELLYALHKAKDGKACGYDEIPVEVLRNSTAREYLLKLFNNCFEYGIVPKLWSFGIVNPIPKNASSDPRVPLNYRGIVLA